MTNFGIKTTKSGSIPNSESCFIIIVLNGENDTMGYSYYRNEVIIRRKTRELFGIGAVVTASSYIVVVVEFMLIGWLLGADAVAAAGLCDSFVDLAEFPGFIIFSGGPIAAGILLGRRQFRRANTVFTLSFIFTLISSLFCCCLLPFCGFFGDVLTNNAPIAEDVSRYAFFAIASAPFVGINLVLSGFAVLDNHSSIAMGSVIASNAVNIILDIVFIKFLNMDVFGAAVASLLGNVAGILVCLPYLFSKKRTFRFMLHTDGLKDVCRELGAASASFAVDKVSMIISGLAVNVLLMYFAGTIGVALYAVYSVLKSILWISAGGALQTISTLGSVLYGERDFFGLRKMMSLLLKYTYLIIAVIVAVLFFFSAPFLRSYGIDPSMPGMDAMSAFRIMLLCMPVLWLNELLARLYPTIQRQDLSVLLLLLHNVIFKILLLMPCAAAVSKLHYNGLTAVAVWCFCVEFLSLAIALIREKQKYKNIALLGMKDQASPDCHTFSITGKPENVADVHREIENFCRQNHISNKKGTLLAIAFEEAALRIINHNKNVDMIDICLLLEDNSLIVRIRDNGAPFDPLAFVDEEDILQLNNINLLEKLTSQKTYTRIMNMNNTVLSINLGI